MPDLAVRDLGVRRLLVGVRPDCGVDAPHDPPEPKHVRERRRLALRELVFLDVLCPDPETLDDRVAAVSLSQPGWNDSPQRSVGREAFSERLVGAARERVKEACSNVDIGFRQAHGPRIPLGRGRARGCGPLLGQLFERIVDVLHLGSGERVEIGRTHHPLDERDDPVAVDTPVR